MGMLLRAGDLHAEDPVVGSSSPFHKCAGYTDQNAGLFFMDIENEGADVRVQPDPGQPQIARPLPAIPKGY